MTCVEGGMQVLLMAAGSTEIGLAMGKTSRPYAFAKAARSKKDRS